MLTFSRGWQMEEPTSIKRRELLEVFAKRRGIHLLGSPPAISNKPEVLWGTLDYFESEKIGNASLRNTSMDPITWSMVVHHLFAESNSTPRQNEAQDAILRWCSRNSKMALEISVNPRAKAKSRLTNYGHFLSTEWEVFTKAAHIAGYSKDELSDWNRNHAVQDLAGSSALGLYFQVMHDRLRDGQRKWKENDFIDMQYLTAATAYTDLVVAERTTLNDIEKARRTITAPLKAQTARNFSEAAPILDNLGL
jgi:hypothetical protein